MSGGIMSNTLNKNQLARQVGISSRHIRRIFSGAQKPRPALAERLEKVTGVEAPCWVWPERYNLKQKIKEVMGVEV